jgi:hypothetical protein
MDSCALTFKTSRSEENSDKIKDGRFILSLIRNCGPKVSFQLEFGVKQPLGL